MRDALGPFCFTVGIIVAISGGAKVEGLLTPEAAQGTHYMVLDSLPEQPPATLSSEPLASPDGEGTYSLGAHPHLTLSLSVQPRVPGARGSAALEVNRNGDWTALATARWNNPALDTWSVISATASVSENTASSDGEIRVRVLNTSGRVLVDHIQVTGHAEAALTPEAPESEATEEEAEDARELLTLRNASFEEESLAESEEATSPSSPAWTSEGAALRRYRAPGYEWPSTWPLFLFGAALCIFGLVQWYGARGRAKNAALEASASDTRGPFQMLEQLRPPLAKLASDIDDLSPEAVCERIDEVLDDYIHPIVAS
jgi:hypothetical protein